MLQLSRITQSLEYLQNTIIHRHYCEQLQSYQIHNLFCMVPQREKLLKLRFVDYLEAPGHHCGHQHEHIFPEKLSKSRVFEFSAMCILQEVNLLSPYSALYRNETSVVNWFEFLYLGQIKINTFGIFPLISHFLFPKTMNELCKIIFEKKLPFNPLHFPFLLEVWRHCNPECEWRRQ